MEEQTIVLIDLSASSTPETLPLVVGVDLGGTQIRAAVLRGATLLSRVSLPTGENPTPERAIPRMLNAVHQALSDVNVSLDQIAGVGIGAPGPLSGRTGMVFSPPTCQDGTTLPYAIYSMKNSIYLSFLKEIQMPQC